MPDLHEELKVLYTSLKKDAGVQFSDELINYIDNSKFVYFPYHEIDKVHAYKVYSKRYKMSKELNINSVFGYETLLEKLEPVANKFIGIGTVVVEDKTFIVFGTEYMKKIISILKSHNGSYEQTVRLQIEYKTRGLTASGVIVDKGNISEI